MGCLIDRIPPKDMKTIVLYLNLLMKSYGRNKQKRTKGFTLVEIVAVVVVLSILGLFTFSFVEYAIKTYLIGSKERIIYHEAAYAIERITREVRDAIRVDIQNPGTDFSSIRIVRKAHRTGMDSDLTNIDFWRSGSTLIRTSDTASGKILGNRITRFRVDPENCSISGGYSCPAPHDPRGIITITLSITDQDIPLVDSPAKTATITTRVSPKNYSTTVNQYTGRYFNGDYEDVVKQ